MSALPEEWRETNVGEIAKTNVSSIGRNYEYDKILYLDTSSITKGEVEGVQKLNFNDAPSRAKRLVKHGDIIYSTVRPNQEHYGFVENPEENLVVSTGFTVVENDKDNSDSKFLYYFLTQRKVTDTLQQIAEQSTSTYPSIKPADIEGLPILIPTVAEQKTIANILSSFDEKIELLREQNKTLETLAQTIFKEWFVNFNFPNEQGKPYRDNGGEMVDSELGEIPKGWRVVKVCELFEVRDGTHDSPKQQESGKLLITSRHLQNHKLDFENAYLISDKDYENINKRSLVETRDILFSMIGTIGLTYFEQSKNIDYAIKNVGLFKTSQNSNWAYYTYLWLTSSLGKDYVFSNKSGSTQEYIALTSLRNITYCEPPEAVLGVFNSAVSEVFNKIKNNTSQILTLSKTRDALLPKLINGQVRVTDG